MSRRNQPSRGACRLAPSLPRSCPCRYCLRLYLRRAGGILLRQSPRGKHFLRREEVLLSIGTSVRGTLCRVAQSSLLERVSALGHLQLPGRALAFSPDAPKRAIRQPDVSVSIDPQLAQIDYLSLLGAGQLQGLAELFSSVARPTKRARPRASAACRGTPAVRPGGVKRPRSADQPQVVELARSAPIPIPAATTLRGVPWCPGHGSEGKLLRNKVNSENLRVRVAFCRSSPRNQGVFGL